MTVMLMAVETFGDSLKRLRESRPMSGAAVARRSGMSASYVSRLEFGSRVPSLDTVLMLAAALNCSQAEEDSLLMAAGYLPRHGGLHPDLLALNEALADDGLPAGYREAIEQSVAALLHGCAAVRGEREMELAVPAQVELGGMPRKEAA